MKKIALTIMIFAGVFTSCSTDDLTINEQESVSVPFSDPVAAPCTDATAIGGQATLSSYTGPQITFTWNNNVEHNTALTYVSYIEIAEDISCPVPAGAPAVAGNHPIDVFNTSTFVLPQGVSSKCFNWRIVINASNGSQPVCTTVTPWKAATYIQ